MSAPPAWVSEWIGIPYGERGRSKSACDCFGLYILLNQHRRNVVIPDPFCTVFRALRRGEVARNMGLYEKVDTPTEGDAILIRQKGHPIHIGYCVSETFMLHCDANVGYSSVERWSGHRWVNRLEGVFRYVG